jgi:hypothetical protein
MWTRATLAIGVQDPSVALSAVEQSFNDDGRFGKCQWLVPDRVIVADSLWTISPTRRRIKVEAMTSPEPSGTMLRITSVSRPLYDWGSNGRHIRRLVKLLAAAGVEGELSEMTSAHTLGGPKD